MERLQRMFDNVSWKFVVPIVLLLLVGVYFVGLYSYFDYVSSNFILTEIDEVTKSHCCVVQNVKRYYEMHCDQEFFHICGIDQQCIKNLNDETYTCQYV